jgi:DNA-binding winged helix-turn-helix (wHTH) protein
LARPGEAVPREELQQRLWPTDTFVDFDHGVNTAINRLREALGDSAENPRFIETVPRRGYRFIAPVEAPATAVAKTIAPVTESSLSAATLAETPTPSPTSGTRKKAIATAVVIAVVNCRPDPPANTRTHLWPAQSASHSVARRSAVEQSFE